MNNVHDLARARREGRRLAMVTAYDVLTARILEAADVDAILVGDSVAMVVHGLPSTVHATLEMMALHTAAVRRGAPRSLVVADLPFLAVRRGRQVAVEAAGALMCAGANAVKAEGLAGHAEVLAHLIESGIPVMGHLGLTPQAVHQIGGYQVQGRTEPAAERIRTDARRLEGIGAFAVVLECVPATLAADVTAALTIPTIGIGAGAGTSGQVLVVSDLLGLDADFRPRFARRYHEGRAAALEAVRAFVRDVRGGAFPAAGEVLA
ncbi:MAG: 3-methyl-2-oxobutanoate hydroxymethyltransferase [Verrucomicrobia bacterium]|nr:3-methyl-2-oxobutanoate hydroxymethyltransferase [Verrucomicrobiota bacterium]